ncbi:Acyl carrier protein [Amycolatopsis pretoriensis]|uniref:Acyl carrier protein n=1 Tax=Amycolatopsis pretoriensis TaxID=218821 RepID=A0A1H5RKQ9_9PSEU|nr:acyl carrier protein [Amycolatopsis pretoriensis]SEF38097.1 Acyl carrier protein [Amycolatopsis pretoriensis]
MATEEVLDVVVRYLAGALELPKANISQDSQLSYLENADSLRLMDAIAAIENDLDVRINGDDLVFTRTVSDLAELVEATLARSAGRRK